MFDFLKSCDITVDSLHLS